MKSKVCTKCRIEKPVDEFYVRKSSKDGRRCQCIKCENKDCNEYKSKNKDELKKYATKYIEENYDIIRAKKRAFDKKHNNKRKRNKRLQELKKIDPQFNIKDRISSRLRYALKSQPVEKRNNYFNVIGCSINELIMHLEKQFTKDMTWEKLMNREIHIDHRLPCKSFDLTDPEEQKACFHFTNLQPLWAIDNIRKSDKIEYLL